MKRTLLAGILVTLPFACSAAECSRDQAYAAEAVVDYLDSWDNVHLFYKQFQHCYDGGIAEGVQDRIQQLWVKRWNELPRMVALTKQDVAFEVFVLRSLSTENFPQDAFASVLRNAKQRCPRVARSFCKAVQEEARRS